MFNKALFISMLVLSISLVWALEASAWYCSRCRSICMGELVNGPTGNKNETYNLVDISVKKIIVESWLNPTGKTGGEPSQGTFSYSSNQSLLTGEQVLGDKEEKGNVLVEQHVTSCVMWDFIWCKSLKYDEDDPDNPGKTRPICVEYKCKTYENPDEPVEGECATYYEPDDPDAYENCLGYGGICPDDSYYAYSEKLTDYPANSKWSPEPPSCDDAIHPLGSLDNDGDAIIYSMWVVSLRSVWDCPDTVIVPSEFECGPPKSKILDEGCWVLEDVNDPLSEYEKIENINEDACALYPDLEI